MSCPVVRAIESLYGSYQYGDDNVNHEVVTIYTPSGIIGGGSSQSEIRFETAKFYITVRKLQFARAELSGDERQFERMFMKSHMQGKTSTELLSEILAEPTRSLYLAITRAIDIIEITEGVCCTVLARDFPSGMSLPTVEIDPTRIECLTSPENIYYCTCKLTDYATKLSVGGVRADIEPLPKFEPRLREFTITGDYQQMLAGDMEVAEYAYLLEQYQASAVSRISEVMRLCQEIVDLACANAADSTGTVNVTDITDKK